MNSSLISNRETLPPTPPRILDGITALEKRIQNELELIDLPIEHMLHAGMYARTVRMPAGSVIVGTLVKIPTLLIVNGTARVLAGNALNVIEGYQIIPASASRKQVFEAIGPVEITMIFPTQAETVEQAEEEFTDEFERLQTRRQA